MKTLSVLLFSLILIGATSVSNASEVTKSSCPIHISSVEDQDSFDQLYNTP